MTPNPAAPWHQRLRTQVVTALVSVTRLADQHGPGWALTRVDAHQADASWVDTEWAPTEWPDTCIDPTQSGWPEEF